MNVTSTKNMADFFFNVCKHSVKQGATSRWWRLMYNYALQGWSAHCLWRLSVQSSLCWYFFTRLVSKHTVHCLQKLFNQCSTQLGIYSQYLHNCYDMMLFTWPSLQKMLLSDDLKRMSSELQMQLNFTLDMAGHSRSACIVQLIVTERYQSCMRIPPSMVFFCLLLNNATWSLKFSSIRLVPIKCFTFF